MTVDFYKREIDICLIRIENKSLVEPWLKTLKSTFEDFCFVESSLIVESENNFIYGIFLYFNTEVGDSLDYERQLLSQIDFTKEPPKEGLDLEP